MASAVALLSVEFEIFGIVQGVFFRKFTQDTARKLGLVGWVKNTSAGTVTGVVQGPEPKVKQMQSWLATEGSPMSKIEKCKFKNVKPITKLYFTKFSVESDYSRCQTEFN